MKQRLYFIRKKIFYYLFCDTIICPSELAKKDLKDYYGIQKGFVVLNPMVDRFQNKTVLSNNSIVLSYLGRLDSSKGVLNLVIAFEAYKKKQKDSKMVLNIAGSGSQIAQIIESATSTIDLNYLGGLSYDKIDAYLNESHFVIIPSKFDAFNVVGIEAMMNQTPILVSKTTGLSHYLTEGRECFKFAPNIDSMIELFEKVERHFGLQEQMALQARATYLDLFSIENYCDTFSKIVD